MSEIILPVKLDTTGQAAGSVRAKVGRWIADSRIVVHNDPEVIPGTATT